AAAATHGRAATAHALLHLAAGPVGSGLAMGGAHPPLAAQRVSRLLQPKPPLRLHRLQLVATSLATLFVPTGFGIALTSATLRLHFCPPPT
ncbi:MAG TPA: hypothetical protein VFH80_04375, partial [Solirubrobacteraceae bacterium]|nr:hypothetical protein [Solirubrobacteraceae bacterium]